MHKCEYFRYGYLFLCPHNISKLISIFRHCVVHCFIYCIDSIKNVIKTTVFILVKSDIFLSYISTTRMIFYTITRAAVNLHN